MIYNPNNVATEASPHTTELERTVGRQLCEMLGYNRQDQDPAPWGHITCVSISPRVAFHVYGWSWFLKRSRCRQDGSVANLEAIWASMDPLLPPLSTQGTASNHGLSFSQQRETSSSTHFPSSSPLSKAHSDFSAPSSGPSWSRRAKK